MVAKNAGMPATPADLINVDEVIGKYYDVVPDPNVPEQRVSFGTSGHRGSSLKTSFNEAHIVAITQAIAEYRKKAGVTGPLYLGSDTHALSGPAKKTAIEVLVANGVHVRVDSRDDFVPTPVVSQAILTHNRAADGTQRFEGEGLADGIVVTPSHNPPTDGGFKYDPVTGGPAVNESLETNLPGVFAAGNVLHVHDLVDYVSEEAAAAGEHAAAYIAGGGAAAGRTLPVRCENGVRYTVPTTIRPDCAGDTVTLRFRVDGVYKNKKIAVYRGTDCIYSRKRPVLAPGEMETVRLKAELLRGPGDAVTVTLEEG